ncbi:MAG: M23 family metallopeptidase [Pseudomonadota bacterium]|nr:M23 family metallopeptidase [Pseudomonadota bacterium]
MALIPALIPVLILAHAAHAQDYAFPSSAEDYGNFYPTAYVDHGGVTDWNCGDTSYDGHRGSDYGGGSWTGMDAGRDITASAPGTVVATNDGAYDRCDTGDCDGGGGFGNYVKLQHADGKATYYAHMKTWSVAVTTGQTVTCGQKLGEMGSSGSSTGPHVHFEVRDSTGSSSDPFDGPCSAPPSYWVDQGAWGGLPSIVCEDVPACAVVDRLRCGQTIASANNGGGATSSHASYGCGEYSYSGPEIAFEFATNLAEGVTLSMSGHASDLDLFVLTSEACDGSGAVGCSTNPNADAEGVAFTATAGQRYVVVVDGYEGATSGFSITASCAGVYPGEEVPVDTAVEDTDVADTSGDTARADTAAPDTDRPRARAADWVRLDHIGCGGSAAGVLLGMGLLGRLRRRT